MLKWSVMARRDADAPRRQSTSAAPSDTPRGPKPKRRHSSGRRSTHRHSLGLEADKENQFTSTPIKSFEDLHQFDALRDVSNLTPNDPADRRVLSAKKSRTPSSHRKHKKKKLCLDPGHGVDSKNYFMPFETVDSHIEGMVVESKGVKRRKAPTLPTLGLEYSPLGGLAQVGKTPLGRYLDVEDTPHPNKRARIDHVSDFLHQINFIISPEEERLMESKSTKRTSDDVRVSPLVKQLVDLRFSQLHQNNSSINDLSLDQIVDAILNSSIESQQDDKHSNQHSDSGFKSSTDYSHQLEGNFHCKCAKTSTPVITEKTIINTNETFNERPVDVLKPKKRPSSTHCDNIDKSEESVNFTLKRQRCIRRRRTDDEKKPSAAHKPLLGDDSFDSTISQTPLKPESTFTLTPADNTRRFRRCLLFESPTSLSESCSTTNSSLREARGCVDLDIRCDEDELFVNVVRCKDLYRTSGRQINAYVKVALSDNRRKRNGLLQRTAVQADSSKPFFNHVFKFPLQREEQKWLHIEVWHRDRTSRTSEFLGCMSFDVKYAHKQAISGSYRLLPQSTGRSQNVPVTGESEGGGEGPTMCESQSSVDEIMSLDGLDNDLKRTTSKAALSEQQKYADENLFLRYLELDPTEGPDALPAATQRKATGNKCGRTPFTQTKRLAKAPKAGFGFSVVWTHPPRIERVEKGLPADKAGLLPGDYVIFVDKHNVVMMPEIDILNLIRSYGSQLTLEIFRRNASKNGSVPSVRRLNSTGTCSTTGLPVASSNLVQRRPSTVCSTTNTTSVDYNRKKLHLPQVTFSAEVGNGVIV